MPAGRDRAGLVTNHNTVPYDPRRAFNPSGIRLGMPSVTSRGMGPGEMELIGRWIDEGVQAVKARDEATLDRIAAEVAGPRHPMFSTRNPLRRPVRP